MRPARLPTTAALAVALAVAATVLASVAAGCSGAARADAPPRAPVPLGHLIVMTQSQHSFDNYLGTRAGVAGLPPATCVPLRPPSTQPCVAPYPATHDATPDQLRATAAAQTVSVDGGRMDGFVAAQRTRHSDGRAPLAHYLPADVAPLEQLADRGTLFDHWFSALPGGTIRNRYLGVTGLVTDADAQVPAQGWPDTPTIFDRLQAAGVSWRIYVENYEPALTIDTATVRARRGGQLARVPALAMPRFVHSPALMSHVVDLGHYWTDLAAGRLPAVSWVVTTSSSEQPPSSPARGQRLARSLVNALIASSSWASSAFLLQYDSSGGWYDHVPPPRIGGGPTGLRVPALVVSPYVRASVVDHGTVDAAAVLRLVESVWQLPPLTARDRDAADLLRVFDFRLTPAPAALIGDPAGRAPVHQPDSRTLYAGYGGVVLLAVGAVGAAAAVERRRRTS